MTFEKQYLGGNAPESSHTGHFVLIDTKSLKPDSEKKQSRIGEDNTKVYSYMIMP